jgi:hypothetical protein
VLYCLNTDDHTIPIDGYIFKDYEETDNPEILKTFFQHVEKKYGTRENKEKIEDPFKYRYTGVRPYVRVLDANRNTIRCENVKLGDKLYKGGKVIGIVKHKIPGCIKHCGIRVAPGTWTLQDDGVHAVVGDGGDTGDGAEYMYYQFLTENGMFQAISAFHEVITILDDQETTDEDIHAWRDNEIQKEEV